MKKLFISALLSVTVALSSFAADGNNVNYTVRSNFESQFSTASDVKWTAADSYTKATFVLNNVRTEALYNIDGELIGTTQGITLDQLPVNAKRAFAKKYADYTVKEAVRFNGTQESAYFISAQGEKGAVILKVSDSGFITTVK